MKINKVNLSLAKNSYDSLFFTEEEFRMVKGIDLSVRLEEDDDEGNKVDRWINYVGQRIREIVRSYSFKELMLYNGEFYYNNCVIENEYVIREIKLAAIEQGFYMLAVGDLGLRSGIGNDRKQFSKKDKERVKNCPLAIEKLMDVGLLFGGNI